MMMIISYQIMQMLVDITSCLKIENKMQKHREKYKCWHQMANSLTEINFTIPLTT